MKTRIFLLLYLITGMGLMNVSAQKGTPYHAYPDRIHDTSGYTWVTCDGVNVDFIEYQCDGMNLTKIRQEGNFNKQIGHWKFTSAITGEEFKVVEFANMDIVFDSEGTPTHFEGIWHTNIRGDAGSHYKITIDIKWTAPDDLYLEFIDIKCF